MRRTQGLPPAKTTMGVGPAPPARSAAEAGAVDTYCSDLRLFRGTNVGGGRGGEALRAVRGRTSRARSSLAWKEAVEFLTPRERRAPPSIASSSPAPTAPFAVDAETLAVLVAVRELASGYRRRPSPSRLPGSFSRSREAAGDAGGRDRRRRQQQGRGEG